MCTHLISLKFGQCCQLVASYIECKYRALAISIYSTAAKITRYCGEFRMRVFAS